MGPGSFAGTIDAQLSNGLSAFVGINVPAGSIGSIANTLEDITADLDGQYITSNTDGSLAETLDDVTATWTGIFAGSDFVVGVLAASVTVNSGINGTNVKPTPNTTANHTIESPAETENTEEASSEDFTLEPA